jgi:hypothetical protein
MQLNVDLTRGVTSNVILKHLETCRPFHSNQTKSPLQLKLERIADGLVIVIGMCFGLLLTLLFWKKLGLPVNDWILVTALIAGMTTQVLALPWLGFNIAASYLEWRTERRSIGRRLRRDRGALEAEQDLRHARQLVDFSETALIHTRHYVRRKIPGGADLKILTVLISLSGQFLIRHQYSSAAMERFIQDHGFVPLQVFTAAIGLIVFVLATIWGIYRTLSRRGIKAYHRDLLDLAILLKHAKAKNGARRVAYSGGTRTQTVHGHRTMWVGTRRNLRRNRGAS